MGEEQDEETERGGGEKGCEGAGFLELVV